MTFRKTWEVNNPGFDYIFFNDNDCDEFVKYYYKKYYRTYKKLPKGAQKADLIRYMAISHFGGIYADSDTICLHPLDSYIDFGAHAVVVGLEMTAEIYKNKPSNYLSEYKFPMQYTQYIFAAKKNHRFLSNLLDYIDESVSNLTETQIEELSKTPSFVLELTGPFVFTEILRNFLIDTKSTDVAILPQIYWGFSKWHNIEIPRTSCLEVKVLHLCNNSWK